MSSRRNFLKLLGLAPAVAVATAEAEPSELTIDQAVAELENGRIVKEGLPGPCCQTGHPYEMIVHIGTRIEGEYITSSPTKEGAVKGWLDAALSYAKDRPGTLYWRTKPQLNCRIEGGKEDWMVYSRFVITDAYEIYGSVDDLLHTKKVQGRTFHR